MRETLWEDILQEITKEIYEEWEALQQMRWKALEHLIHVNTQTSGQLWSNGRFPYYNPNFSTSLLYWYYATVGKIVEWPHWEGVEIPHSEHHYDFLTFEFFEYIES